MKKLDVIKDYIASLTYAIAEDESNGPRVQRKEIIREELLKSVPRKMKQSGYTFKCPECFSTVQPIPNYCPNCGQRLDWEEERNENMGNS